MQAVYTHCPRISTTRSLRLGERRIYLAAPFCSHPSSCLHTHDFLPGPTIDKWGKVQSVSCFYGLGSAPESPASTSRTHKHRRLKRMSYLYGNGLLFCSLGEEGGEGLRASEDRQASGQAASPLFPTDGEPTTQPSSKQAGKHLVSSLLFAGVREPCAHPLFFPDPRRSVIEEKALQLPCDRERGFIVCHVIRSREADMAGKGG